MAPFSWRMRIRDISTMFVTALFVPACLVLIILAHWALLPFGAKYGRNGALPLIVLALAVIPLAASNWSWTVLKLTGRLKPLVVSTGIFTLAICGLAWFLAPYGLTALAASWPIGCSVSAIVASAAVAVTPRRAPRHRRPTRDASRAGARTLEGPGRDDRRPEISDPTGPPAAHRASEQSANTLTSADCGAGRVIPDGNRGQHEARARKKKPRNLV